ncbi:MAG TPA: cytochrome c [Rhizomicrobium sp.]|nr:cytochrome c [Rhizomicrobium sp.]
MRRTLIPLVLAIIAPALAETPHLGKPVTQADIARWDIEILADGTGLPPGEGTAAQGAPIFVGKCAVCHGDGGRGTDLSRKGLPSPPALVSDNKLKGMDASRTTIANYWPYAPPLFDYIRRAMPWNEPRTLSDHEVYALTAYILAENKLVDPKQVINAKTLPKVMMPNRDGFLPRFPDLMPK